MFLPRFTTVAPASRAAAAGLLLAAFPSLLEAAADFEKEIKPLLAEFCLKCHSTEKQKGDLDLERFSSIETIQTDPKTWQLVAEQLELGEMPPKKKPQMEPAQRLRLTSWVQGALGEMARAHAGDPGPVVLRRLSNAEYTHTVRDLTGLPAFDPAREFPVDGAAGEGFTNAGAALVMSPALLAKYLEAAKEIARHAMLLPDGVRFSPHTSERDWTEEKLAAIRAFYARFTAPGSGTAVNLQGVKFDTNAGGVLPLEKYLAATLAERAALTGGTKTIATVAGERGLNAKYLGTLWAALNAAQPSLFLETIRADWRAAEPGGAPALAATIAQWQQALWRFTTVGHIGKRDGPKAWQVPATPSTEELRKKFPSMFEKEDAKLVEAMRESAADEFRQLFPAALCYSKIVPVDEVVTLTLFYREDEHLRRLLLDATQAAELDRLWAELHYVSRDALKLVDAFEQIWQFSTQDGDPTVLEPLREPIRCGAAEFRKHLVDTEPAHLDAVLKFANAAWRRPLTDAETGGLRGFYHGLRAQEIPHEEAVRLTLARVLVAPVFLYKMEKPGSGLEPSPVDDFELASRLSYFLWSSAPDAALLAVAAEGRLREPDVLAAETRRMLADPRVRRLAVEFGTQWLQVRDFDQLDEKSERDFPTFHSLRAAMNEEPILFFTDFFQHDRSVLSLLDADHAFVNAALAGHYGISGVAGEEWQRVEGVRAQGRGGILGFAATLAKQSGASRTSPILRGNWLSETLLGERLPRPPQGVPVLPEEAPAGLTERQLTAQHSTDEACARCHIRIDPFGYALEAFDAIGRHRAGQDTHAKLADGTEFEGLDGLRDYLLSKRRDSFERQFCKKLLGYALGRAAMLSDQPLLDEILAALPQDGHRIGTVVETIVQSRQFRDIRGVEFVADR